MTKEKKLKHRIRARMEKTGERYAQARAQVLKKILGESPAAADSRGIREGFWLEPEEVQGLEAHIGRDPEDLTSRLKILSYYTRLQADGPDPERDLVVERHVTWLIQNRPEDETAHVISAAVSRALDSNPRIKALWLDQVDRHGDDPRILRNAARAFQLNDPDTAEDLLRRAIDLTTHEATDGRASKTQVELASLLLKRTGSAEAHELLKASLAESSGEARLAQLILICESGLKLAQEPEVASRALREEIRGYADEALTVAEEHNGAWNYGNAVFTAHQTLGILALAEDDLSLAKENLLQAGKTPGSPQLNSFGPRDWSLAQALAHRGELECVWEFLRSVREFWRLGVRALDTWEESIRLGQVPDFDQRTEDPNIRSLARDMITELAEQRRKRR